MQSIWIFFCLFSLRLFSFEILPESAATRHMGYGDWYINTDGELSLMRQILRPGSVVIDAGANMGEWSRFALETEPSIALTAFEPIPQIFERLKSNLALYPHVHLCNSALSDTAGEGSFHYYDETPERSALSGFYYREVLRGDFQEPKIIQVPLQTLTDFCSENQIEHIDFLKIDTEGAEWKVLKGAEELIKNHRIEVIQFEYGGCYVDAKTTLQQVFRLLTENNYRVFRIIPNGLIHISVWDDYLENFILSNYCAMDERFNALRECQSGS